MLIRLRNHHLPDSKPLNALIVILDSRDETMLPLYAEPALLDVVELPRWKIGLKDQKDQKEALKEALIGLSKMGAFLDSYRGGDLILATIKQGALSLLRHLIIDCKINVNSLTEQGRPLEYALQQYTQHTQHTKNGAVVIDHMIILFLIEQGAYVHRCSMASSFHRTPLAYALQQEYFSIAMTMINRGARTPETNPFLSPFFFLLKDAIHQKHNNLAKMMVDKDNLDIFALRWSIDCENTYIFEFVLKHLTQQAYNQKKGKLVRLAEKAIIQNKLEFGRQLIQYIDSFAGHSDIVDFCINRQRRFKQAHTDSRMTDDEFINEWTNYTFQESINMQELVNALNNHNEQQEKYAKLEQEYAKLVEILLQKGGKPYGYALWHLVNI